MAHASRGTGWHAPAGTHWRTCARGQPDSRIIVIPKENLAHARAGPAALAYKFPPADLAASDVNYQDRKSVV